MRTICIKAKIKEGHIEDVRIWFKTLVDRLDETVETLQNEGVLIESAFVDRQGNDDYLIYYMKAQNIEMAYQIFNQSTAPIDLYFKECWNKYCEGRIVLEKLLDLEKLGG